VFIVVLRVVRCEATVLTKWWHVAHRRQHDRRLRDQEERHDNK
jgi:hypothetical protein